LNTIKLKVSDHSREIAGFRYVYPVLSRRAGGVSVGINLNVNNACNWRCIYCQVPDLKLGSAPQIDLVLLEYELRELLLELLHGDFMQNSVPEDERRINDIALSGNGEPTSAKEFLQVIQLAVKLQVELSLPPHVKLILITNGSLLHRQHVQQGIKLMAQHRGEVWFKLDRASVLGMNQVNNSKQSLEKVSKNLEISTVSCPTWLQTCWFENDNLPPGNQEEDDYLDFLSKLIKKNIRLQGVHLYSIARPSMQAEASHLGAMSRTQLEIFADRIRLLGITVRVSV